MSFVNKFKSGGNNPPPGVKMEHTSFGYAQSQKPYQMPQIPKQNAPTQKIQPRGGWDDEDDDEPQLRGGSGQAKTGNPFPSQANTKKPFAQSPLTPSSVKSDELSLGPSSKKTNPAQDYQIMQIDENFLSSHQFENKTIEDLIQVGGARVKPADSSLNAFCKACESFQVPVMGSLLMCKLYEDIASVSKLRTLYLIEALVKKVKKYFEYVKHNLNILQGADFSADPSAEQLKKLTNDIIQYIQDPNKPKQQINLIPQPTISPPKSQATANLLAEDLLGSPQGQSAVTSKPDPFGFVKKSPEQAKSQVPQARPAPVHQNNNQLLDLDFGSQPAQQSFPQQTQSFSQPQVQAQPQVQSQQPKKFDPFGISSTTPTANQNKAQPVTENLTQNTSKPGAGLNFKKFQGATVSQGQPSTMAAPVQNVNVNKPVTPVTQPSSGMDDLLGSFSGLDFSSNNNTTQPPSQPSFGFQNNTSPVQANKTAAPSNLNQPSSFPSSFASPSSSFGSNQSTHGSNLSSQSNFSSGFGSNQPNTLNSGFNNNFNNPTNPQPYGNFGNNAGPGPSGYGHNTFQGPGYGYGPGPGPSAGFNNASNWNSGGYGGNFNAPQGGPGFNYGQPNYHAGGNFGQPQPQPYGYGGNNFQNPNGMSYNQSNMQGVTSYYNQGGVFDDLTNSPGLHSSEEAAARQEQLKKNQQKQKNEALFDSLRF